MEQFVKWPELFKTILTAEESRCQCKFYASWTLHLSWLPTFRIIAQSHIGFMIVVT